MHNYVISNWLFTAESSYCINSRHVNFTLLPNETYMRSDLAVFSYRINCLVLKN
jgi:hypothetical protein